MCGFENASFQHFRLVLLGIYSYHHINRFGVAPHDMNI